MGHLPSHADNTGTAETRAEGGAHTLLVQEGRGELHPYQQEVHQLLQCCAVNEVRNKENHMIGLEEQGGSHDRTGSTEELHYVQLD